MHAFPAGKFGENFNTRSPAATMYPYTSELLPIFHQRPPKLIKNATTPQDAYEILINLIRGTPFSKLRQKDDDHRIRNWGRYSSYNGNVSTLMQKGYLLQSGWIGNENQKVTDRDKVEVYTDLGGIY